MKSKLFVLLIATFFALPHVVSGHEIASDELHVPKAVPAKLTVYLPIGNAKLVRRKIKGTHSDVMPPYIYSEVSAVADEALTLLFQKASASFPRGTRLTKACRVEKGSDVMEISLSKEFWQRGFWSSKARVSSAIYAIVNTAADYGRPNVQLLQAGQPVRNLANLDLREPLTPREEMVTSWVTDSSDALWLPPPEEREVHWAEAFIGERPSLRSGERSALRWLSRLLQQKPRAKLYRVEWRAINDGVWWVLLLSYAPSKKTPGAGSLGVEYANNSIDIPPPYLRKMDRTEWIGLDDGEIHAVARKSGSLKAFARYARDRDSL